ncbi:MAG: DUF2007 domain-containing protein [Mucilaginibacter polytrichastri]|nr:DUF2007 domain-containing protein [Mucilaginibacter polytrichastri]
MERDWVKIYTSTNFYEAEIIKQTLSGNAIESVMLNKQDSAHKTFGEIEVYVHRHDFSDALELIIRNQMGAVDL